MYKSSMIVILCAGVLLAAILACDLPIAIKNLAETAVPATQTLSLSPAPTEMILLPSPTVTRIAASPIPPVSPTTAPNPPATLPAMSTTPPATSTRVALTNTATPKRPPFVLWDISHGPRSGEVGLYEPDGMFSNLVDLLSKNGIRVVSNRLPLDNVDLNGYAVLVVAMTSAVERDYSAAEVLAVNLFLQQGGSLLILTEVPGFTNRIQPVLDLLQVQAQVNQITGPVGELVNHPLFNGVPEVTFLFGGGSLRVSSSNAEVIAYSQGEAAIMVIDHFPGRVVVIGDTNLFDNRGLPKNEQFAINVFTWLTFSS